MKKCDFTSLKTRIYKKVLIKFRTILLKQNVYITETLCVFILTLQIKNKKSIKTKIKIEIINKK